MPQILTLQFNMSNKNEDDKNFFKLLNVKNTRHESTAKHALN